MIHIRLHSFLHCFASVYQTSGNPAALPIFVHRMLECGRPSGGVDVLAIDGAAVPNMDHVLHAHYVCKAAVPIEMDGIGVESIFVKSKNKGFHHFRLVLE